MDDNDDKIVSFNELKNKAREKDVEKIEDYVYGLCYDMAQGKITMADFSKSLQKYMDENNISQEKMFNIQKELMKRYGIDMEDMENQMKSMGFNIPAMNRSTDYETVRKALSFQEKYKDKIGSALITTYSIGNVEIYINEEKILLKSSGKIDLKDVELNEFLCSYKNVIKDKKLNISICENTKVFEY
ncbi:MAG: DUF3867 domain-containing protein [Clostridium sp.]|jgi:hypothetical protein|uniref:DUF3867 domain-containing protein n=1 Tax=Clostridium sp. TaxID=1506 RepID=UPI0025BE51D5|nr:DUF3867 domain-containing protein [Clostridium sp.]MCH3963235.1 DUF3867 domain-containing protein [Clostridium sp.]MCI1717207.1 DUF3867 domain-containing protein [Clostridium sp.]MCI1801547.1 DUF3867 domain-containing protein [Clostridium sp.]MCI1815393.1 DUF3867 domain-containing protein [Clostridium sp.]MCI1872296.1 DUF3867 domain-containing protein [Clostridium sp.]